MNKSTMKAAAFALAVYAITAAVQRHMFAVPVVGAYLPK